MKQLTSVILIVSSCAFLSCNSNETDRDTSDGNLGRDNTRVDTATTAAVNTTAISDTAVLNFVQKAMSGSMMEIELGNMAATNATNNRVKNFGSMMVADHTQASNELRQLVGNNSAQISNAMLPEHRQHIDMMNSKKGSSFDKAYMDMMVKDHQEDIKQFEKASGSLGAQPFKDFASKTLPVLRKHLDSAQAVRKAAM